MADSSFRSLDAFHVCESVAVQRGEWKVRDKRTGQVKSNLASFGYRLVPLINIYIRPHLRDSHLISLFTYTYSSIVLFSTSCNARHTQRSDPPGRDTHLAQSVHSSVICDPYNLVSKRCTLFRRHCASKGVILASVRHNGGRTTLDDMYRDRECAGECLNLCWIP